MSQEPGWITKAQAAALLAVDERTIERRARAGRIDTRARPGFPTLFWAAHVEMLKQTTGQEVRTGILEPVQAPSSNGNGAVPAVRTRTATFEEVFVDVLQGLRGALTHGAIGPTGPTMAPTGPTPSPAERAAQYLTLAEASAEKRVSEQLLRRWMRAGALPYVREPRSRWTPEDRGWRIRRKDLEQL